MVNEKRISKKIALLIYAVFLAAGLIAVHILGRWLYFPILFCAPSFFFLFFTVISDWKREWDIGFGMFDAFCFWAFFMAIKLAFFF